MKQLATARAVITIWTENSIKSDWVRAEAGRAKADGKLIPVKTTDVTYADIPLPFGEMHTENVGSTDLIKAAVVAQLAKPAVTSSPWWQITSTLKYTILTWIGIVGSTITLFANLNGVLDLADWSRVLVQHWSEWNQMIWGWVFALVKIKVSKEVIPVLSFTVFVLTLIVGVNLNRRSRSESAYEIMKQIDKLRAYDRLKNLEQDFGLAVTPRPAYLKTKWGEKLEHFYRGLMLYLLFILAVFLTTGISGHGSTGLMAAALVCAIPFPIGYLLYLRPAEEWVWILISSLLFLFMAGCLLIAPSWSELRFDYWSVGFLSATFFLQVGWMAAVLFSPLQQLTRRLGFVVVGVLTLIGLSEISKLNLHQYLQPPKVSENSVR
jgi:hypothetical protein